MKKLLYISTILYMLLSLTSCSSYYYSPTSQNVLDFKKEGDIVGGVGFNTFNSNAHLGYAFTDNIGFESSVCIYNMDATEFQDYDAILWDNELVLYKPLKHNFITAVNFGNGYGEFAKYNRDYFMQTTKNNDFKLTLNRNFIQPSFGYSTNYFDFAISARVTSLVYDLEMNNAMSKADRDEILAKYELGDVGEKPFYFVEPAVTIGVGYKWIKFRLQHCIAYQLDAGSIQYESYTPNLSINFKYNID